MTSISRLLLGAAALCGMIACADAPTASNAADDVTASFKADPAPLTIAELSGSWTQTPKQRVPWSDGVTPGGWMDRWYVLSLQQKDGQLRGNANGFAQYFYQDGTVRTGVVSTGGGLKLSGSVTSFTNATIVFQRGGGESTGPNTLTVSISADQRTLTVINPTPGGFQAFTR